MVNTNHPKYDFHDTFDEFGSDGVKAQYEPKTQHLFTEFGNAVTNTLLLGCYTVFCYENCGGRERQQRERGNS